MKELRALKRVIKLRNLNKTYDKILNIAYNKNIKILNEREFYQLLEEKKINLNEINEPVLVLKHDVDRMLTPIPIIDKIEKRYNASSTYHVRADENQYKLSDAKEVFKGLDVALHLVGDVVHDKTKISQYFENVIGCSTHGGHEKEFIFNKELISELSEHFKYVSDGLLRPDPICFRDNFLIIPIDSADIYFEDLFKKVNEMIEFKKVMILNTHVEYFIPKSYLKAQFKKIFRI